MADCPYCYGSGDVGPVHIIFGNGTEEWRSHMACSDCGGSGSWSSEHVAAYERGQEHRRTRIAAGETILQCAQRLGISPAEVSRMERGLEARNG